MGENDQMLERFVDFYQNKPLPRTTLHGYILQMLWDIYNHDQRDEDDEDGDENEQNEDGPPSDDPELEQRDSVVINEEVDDNDKELQEVEETKEKESENEEDEEEEFGDDVVLKP